MLNFGRDPWSFFRGQANSKILDMITKEGTSVQDILEAEGLNDIKNQNEKVIKFFDHDKLAELIELITVMPSEEDTHDRQHKFPFQANEIFGFEINTFLDKFFEAPEPKTPKAKTQEVSITLDEEHKKEESDDEMPGLEDQDNIEDEQQEKKEKVIAQEMNNDNQVKEPESEDQVEEDKKDIEVELKDIKPNQQDSDSETQKNEDLFQQENVQQNVEQSINGQLEQTTDQQDQPSTIQIDLADEEEQTKEALDQEDIDLKDTTKLSINLEPEEEDDLVADEREKYHLLDKLFKFIQTRETPLNPVLSGYFVNLVNTLFFRRNKQMIVYIFRDTPKIIDDMLFHAYQKSISDLLKKLMIVPTDFEAETAEAIKNQQSYIMSKLIEKLGAQHSDEENLNACLVIYDLIELKEPYQLISLKMHIMDIFDRAFPTYSETNQSSQCAAISVLTKIVKLFPENQKRDQKRKANHQKEEFSFSLKTQDSDLGENEDIQPLIIVLQQNQSVIFESLLTVEVPNLELQTTFGQNIRPLGRLRLRIVEFIKQLVSLNNPSILNSLVQSEILSNINDLFISYPWNNFLQLFVQKIYVDLLEVCEDEEIKYKGLKNSKIAEKLINIQSNTNFTHQSNRQVRQGYMALVIQIANLLDKHKDDDGVKEYLEENQVAWSKFMNEEVKVRNELNSRKLGNLIRKQSEPEEPSDDDQDLQFDIHETNKKKEEIVLGDGIQPLLSEPEEHNEEIKDNITSSDTSQENSEKFFSQPVNGIIETHVEEIIQQQNLEKDFIDQNYWKINIVQEDSLEDLLKDYE
ncbi:UNKNOWN [Stylonychia lemnae]|uniref:Uncharacterized protein n=1 Tax=Stylonychia lemnae TaxID=5949 RepID=A0A078A1M5_STYLE|nr:UNKNOWN [Stylonychia lemnae]|eukprot:CDW76161.1 UNKNOWN [Stylonychia lemnae]